MIAAISVRDMSLYVYAWAGSSMAHAAGAARGGAAITKTFTGMI